MKNWLLQLIFLCALNSAYGQHYAYSFEGSPSANTLTSLHSKIELLSGVQTVKVRLKEGANKGEVIIFCEPIEGEQDAQFNASSLKGILIAHNLSPKAFIKLK